MAERMAEVLTEHELPGPDRGAARPSPRPPGSATVVTGELRARLRRRRDQAGRLHRRRPVRPAHRRQGQPQDAGPAQEPDRPAGAQPRRRGGAQPARRRPLRGDGPAQVAGLDPGVPGDRVRAVQARPAGRPAVRADGRPGPGDPLRRRGEPDAGQDGRRRLGQAQGPGPQGGPRDRRRADQAVRGPAGHPRPRVLRRTPPGSASSRTRSASSRPRTSWPRSRRSSGTWSRSCRWTG